MRMILIRFGDLVLKGKNIHIFVNRIKMHIKDKLNDLNPKIDNRHDRIYCTCKSEDLDEVITRLLQIPGIHSISNIYKTTTNLDDIINLGVKILDEQSYQENTTFKIETKRADKKYPYTSLEVTKLVSGPILKQTKHKFIVQVKDPKITLNIEIRQDGAYLFLDMIKGMGGFPYGSAGKGLLMMSGGIDSPVSAYLAMKQGLEVDLIHFESTPLTPLESVQKVFDLAKKLAVFTNKGKIRLHVVPFFKMHEQILSLIPDPYIITVLRRMMYRLAVSFAKKHEISCLINGESIGQVASQTIESITTIESVVDLPVIRPLVTFDKQEIITIAKKIDTFDISIKPFNDCCSIYTPKHPATKPRNHFASNYEKVFNYEEYLKEALNDTVSIIIHSDSKIVLSDYGLEASDAIKTYLNELGEKRDNLKTE